MMAYERREVDGTNSSGLVLTEMASSRFSSITKNAL